MSSVSNSVAGSPPRSPPRSSKLSKSYNVSHLNGGGINLRAKLTDDRYADELRQKFELTEKRVQERKMRKLKEHMLSSELNMLKEEGHKYNHKKLLNIQEYNRDKNLQNILARQIKADQKKQEKFEILQQKRQFVDSIKMKKKMMMENLEKASKKPKQFLP